MWREKELEDYLLVPEALASLAGLAPGAAERMVTESVRHRGKEGLAQALRALGIPDAGPGTIMRHTLANFPASISAEVWAVGNLLRRLLSLPDLEHPRSSA